MTTQTSGVLNRPPSISELTRPPQQVPITRQGGINLQRTHRRVRNRVHCRSGVASLMWINSDDHILSSLLSEKRGHRDRQADFETHSGNITPLLSQTAASRQLGGTPRESQPKEVADDSRASPANDLPDATTPQPQRPVTHIQVGDSVEAVESVVDYPWGCGCFVFGAVGGELYEIDVALGILGDSVVEVYDAAGVALAHNDDRVGSLASRVVWRALASGEFYVGVAGYGEGSYTLTVSVSE